MALDVRDETLNRAGRTRAMTALTAVRPWYRPPGGRLWVRAVFSIARRATRRPGTIQELSFIHFARWGLITHLPHHGQPRDQLRRPLFMFESNYNGTFDQYIDAFAEVLTTGMTLFWGSSYGWPSPKPVARFKEYIHANEFVADHYYSAYPTATVTMITTALNSQVRHLAFRDRARSLPPAEFGAAFHRFLAEEGRPAPRPAEGRESIFAQLRSWLRPAPPGNRSGRSYYFVCLAPIRAGSGVELARRLGKLQGASPLSRLPDVHFGRWLIIEDLQRWRESGTRLQNQYLLFSACITAPDAEYADALPNRFLDDLLTAVPEADDIWGHCHGYPAGGPMDKRVSYLARGELSTLLFYVGYPDTTVAQVRQALNLREQLLDFAQAHQLDRDPALLKRAYFEESTAWFPSN
jgi:hypothetical protein